MYSIGGNLVAAVNNINMYYLLLSVIIEHYCLIEVQRRKINPKNFNLFTITRELTPNESHEMIIRAFNRILNNERNE